MKFHIPHKALLVNILIITLIAVQIAFITLPNLVTIDRIKKDIGDQYAEVSRQLALGQTTKKILEDLKNIRPLLEKIAGFFLKESEQLTFITTLENLALKNNLEIKLQLSDIPENDVTEEEIFTIPLSLTLTGSYTDTIKFLIEMQNQSFYINITNLSINASREQKDDPDITTSLRANTYWKR